MGRGRKKKEKVGKRGSTWKEAPVVSFATCRCSVTASAGVNSESEMFTLPGFTSTVKQQQQSAVSYLAPADNQTASFGRQHPGTFIVTDLNCGCRDRGGYFCRLD